MDKFILAKNPLREKSGIWINHMLNPKAIIRCSEGHTIPNAEIYCHYQFANSKDLIEEWTLSIYHIAYDEQQSQILDRAWRWFRAYLETKNLLK